MGLASVNALVDALRGQSLLASAQLAEVERDLRHQHPDARSLAADLLRRDWLTPFQVNQLLQERGLSLVLGGHVLLERLGEGGMGQVFKARHLRLGRLAAIKVIRPELLAEPSALARFEREAKAAARLGHPNIVAVYDFGEDKGTHFLIMEYVAGIDLARKLAQDGPLSVAAACDCLRQTALGLQHAHEQGLVHRDIKPHNLLLTGGGVKILDMGLARGPQTTDGAITRDGVLVGTLDYLAPEQARNTNVIDPRSDLYSLGCTGYQLLTGRTPFPEAPACEKLLNHQLDEPTPVRELRPDVPPDIAAVVHKLMAKKPELRYQTAREVADVLTRFDLSAVTAERLCPVFTAPAPTSVLPNHLLATTALEPPTKPRPARRRRVILVGLGLFLLLFLFIASRQEEPQQPHVEQPEPVVVDPIARALPDETAALLRVEVKKVLEHPWVKNGYREMIFRAARDNPRVRRDVPPEQFWERIDLLAVGVGADEKSGDVWAIEGPLAGELFALFRRGQPTEGIYDLKDNSFGHMIDLNKRTTVFSQARAPLRQALDRPADAPRRRPDALLARRAPDDLLWVASQREAFDRLPKGPEHVDSVLDTVRASVEAIELGLALDATVRLRASLIARTPADVEPLHEMTTNYLNAFRGAPILTAYIPELAPVFPLLSKATVSRSEREVALRCEMDTTELLAAVKKLEGETKKWKKP